MAMAYIVERQPHFAATNPLIMGARKGPTSGPKYKSPSARRRFSGT